MPRRPRISYPNAFFHIVNRFVDRHPFFERPCDYAEFLECYFEAATHSSIRTYAYCIMPNHFHFCVQTETGEISRFLHKFLTRSVKNLNRRHQRTGHLLQGRTQALLVEDQNYFETVIGYILLNPVRAKLVHDPWLYPHSFAREMLLANCRIDRRDLATRVTGRHFAVEDVPEQIRAFQKWAERLDMESNEHVFKENSRGAFLSSAAFRRSVLAENERRAKLQIGRSRRRTDREWWHEWAEVRKVVRELFDSPGVSFSPFWKNSATAEYELAIFAAHEFAGWTFDRIRELDGDRRGISSYTTAASRVRNNSEKLRIVSRLVSLCQFATP